MDKNVKITVKTRQMQEGDTQKLEFVYQGMYFQKDDHFYVLYEEPVEGSTEVIKNRIKFSHQFVEVVKKGMLSSTMYFQEGRSFATEYATPFGTLLLQIETYHYHMEWMHPDKVQLSICYKMSNEQGAIAQCEMEIQILS